VGGPTAPQPAEPPQPASPAKAQPAPAAEEEAAEKARALAARRREAFQSLGVLTETVVRDLPNEFDTQNDKNTVPPYPIDLGPFDVDHLVTPSFAIAVPEEKSGLNPFTVRVVPREEAAGPRRWVIAEVGAGIDENELIPLAELEATEGVLKLRAVDSSVYGQPGFLLLRRSVLLVRAADPNRPGATAEVRREIRLVRPQDGPRPQGIRLVDNQTTIRIPCPPVALKSQGTGAAPRLPRGWHARCRVEYGFDRSGTRRPEGSPVVETFTLMDAGGDGAAMSHDCQLLEVKPTARRPFPAASPSFLSLVFKISPAEGVIEVEPMVTGAARQVWSIGDLRELVETDDKKHAEEKKRIERSIRQRINEWCKPEVDQFGGQAEKEVADLIREPCARWAKEYPLPTGPHLEAFLAKALPPPARESWDNRLLKIRERVAAIPKPQEPGNSSPRPTGSTTPEEYRTRLAPLGIEWKQEFGKRIQAWADAYIADLFIALDEGRSLRPPLMAPVTITVEKVWTTAQHEAGTTYEVPLVTPVSLPEPRSDGTVPKNDKSPLD